jgi:O-antigen/teichoic acid export membrane protein
MAEEEIKSVEPLAKTVVKSGFWNFFTSIIARLGGLIFTILIARILQPELFGVYSLAISVLLLMVTFSDMGINLTLMRYLASALTKNNKNKAAAYFSYLFQIKLILTFSFSALLILLSYPLSVYIFRKPDLFFPLLLCAIYLIFLSLIGFYESIFYTIQKVQYITLKETIYQILRVSLAVLGVYIIANKVVGTILGIIVASFVTLLLLFWLSYKNHSYLFKKSAGLGKTEKKELLKFLFYITIGGITGAVFGYIDTVILGIFVHSEFIGYYRAAFTLVGGMIGLISITNFLLPIFVQLKEERLEKVFNKVFKYIALLAFPIALGMAWIAKPFINIIFGSSYLPAAIPLYILSLTIIDGTLGPLFTWLFAAKGKPQITTKLLLFFTVLNIILTFVLVYSMVRINEMYALIGASLAVLISRLLTLITMGIFAKKILNLKIYVKNITKPLFASILMLIALIIFQSSTKLIWPKSIIEIIFAAMVYFVVLIAIKGVDTEDVRLIKKLF